MCVVSMISEHFMGIKPRPQQWGSLEYSQFEELLRKAKEYDKLMGQADCPDPAKEEWMVGLHEYMAPKIIDYTKQ